jgi:hypothetical protein
MADTKTGPDLPDLSAWQAALAGQIEELRSEISTKQVALAQAEERLSLVTKLIEVETRVQKGHRHGGEASGSSPSGSTGPRARENLDLESAVEDILRGAGEPLHISTIREALLKKGVPVPGRGDEANIIVRLRRLNDRFTRTARGTYGLAEWALPPLVSRTQRGRRSAAR